MNDKPTARFWHAFDKLNAGNGQLLQDLKIGAPRKKRTPKPGRVSEWREQSTVIDWWTSYSRTKQIDERLLMSIPNGSHMRGGQAQRKLQLIILSKTGMRAGAPDLLLALPRSPYSGFFVEMKAKDGRESDDQIDFGELLRTMGYRAEFCYGADQAIEVIRGYVEGV